MTRREAFAACVGGWFGGLGGVLAADRRAGRVRRVLSPARRTEILAAYRGNVDAGAAIFAGQASVREEDFTAGITSAPCPPLTWSELLALMERDAS